jgi:hypothetical protein
VRSLCWAILFCAWAVPGLAGTVWHDPSDRGGTELQIAFPVFEEGDVFAQVVSPTGRLRISEDLVLHADVPFSAVSSDGEWGTVLGNPYLGVELGKEDMEWTLEGGVRAPLVPGSPSAKQIAAIAVGALTDFVLRPGAFVVDAVPLELNFHYRSGQLQERRATAHLGFEAWAPIGDREESERFFTYGGHLWWWARPLRINLGAEGRLQFDEGGDDNELELKLGLQAETRNARPGLEIRVPVDELQDLVDVTIAVYVGIH